MFLVFAIFGIVSASSTWPGSSEVWEVDSYGFVVENLSGLTYQPSSVSQNETILWAVQNNPPTLYKLIWNGTTWVSVHKNGWQYGKRLYYSSGTGSPDTEGVTKSDWNSSSIYVCTEYAGSYNPNTSLSIMMYRDEGSSNSLNAVMQWNFDADFDAVYGNLGFEGIGWVPDSHLVKNGFIDDNTGQIYDPNMYANNGGGLFLAGLESDGFVYVYALDHVTAGWTRITSFYSGSSRIMSIDFDRDSGYLWTLCDSSCNGIHNIHVLDPATGTFRRKGSYNRPNGLGNYDLEGISLAPDSQCLDGLKPVFWADDDDNNGHSLRQGMVECGSFLSTSSSPHSDFFGKEHNIIIVVGCVFAVIFVASLAIFCLYARRKTEGSESIDFDISAEMNSAISSSI
jgi:hypothetical protein